MNIIQKIIPSSYTRIRPGIPMNSNYITVHETDNTSKGADAEAHARLLASGNPGRQASWHFTVDNHSIYQSLPTNEVGWHAGDGSSGTGNRQSIGIEICVNSDGNFTQAKENAAWLVRWLMEREDISLSHVVQHNRWSGKNCPRKIRGSGTWGDFINMIQGKNIDPEPYDKNRHYHRLLAYEIPMMRGDDVKRVQKRLQIADDGIYGPVTEEAVRNWQRVHDANGNVVSSGSGLAADGIVGPKTWGALFPGSDVQPPIYRITVDGKVMMDTAYVSKILGEVEKAVKNEVGEVVVRMR